MSGPKFVVTAINLLRSSSVLRREGWAKSPNIVSGFSSLIHCSQDVSNPLYRTFNSQTPSFVPGFRAFSVGIASSAVQESLSNSELQSNRVDSSQPVEKIEAENHANIKVQNGESVDSEAEWLHRVAHDLNALGEGRSKKPTSKKHRKQPIKAEHEPVHESTIEAIMLPKSTISSSELLEVLRKVHESHIACPLFKWANRSHMQSDKRIYGELIRIADESKDAPAMKWITDHMKENNVLPSKGNFCRIINTFGKANMRQEVESAVQAMKLQQIKFEPHLLGALIHFQSSWGNRAEVLKLCEEYSDGKMTPGAPLVRIMALALTRLDDSPLVGRLLGEIRTRGLHLDTPQWKALIEFHGRHGDAAEALACFRELIQSGKRPDPAVMKALVAICSSCGKLQDLKATLSAVKMSSHTLNLIVDAFSDAYLFDEALEYLKSFSSKAEGVATGTYGRLIRVYSILEQHDKVLELYEGMGERKVAPNPLLWGILIKSFGEMGDLAMAAAILEEMKARGESPNVVHWSTLVDLYAKRGKVVEAMKCFQDMAESGVRPNSVTWTSLIGMCGGRSGMLATAEQLLQRMVESGAEPNEHTWSTLIHICAKEREAGRAQEWFQRMVGSGVRASVVSMSSLMAAYLRAGLHSEAEEVFRRMRQEGIKPSLDTFVALLGAFVECEGAGEGGVVLLRMMGECRHPSHRAFLALFVGGTAGNRLDLEQEMEGLFQEMSRSPLGHQRSITRLFLQLMYQRQMGEAASRMWEAAKESRLWRRTLSVKEDEAGKVWKVDLRGMTVGASQFCVCCELMQLRESVGAVPQKWAGFEFRVDTGVGVGDASLKQAMVDMLDEMRSPFKEQVGSASVLSANGREVEEWLARDGVGALLQRSMFETEFQPKLT